MRTGLALCGIVGMGPRIEISARCYGNGMRRGTTDKVMKGRLGCGKKDREEKLKKCIDGSRMKQIRRMQREKVRSRESMGSKQCTAGLSVGVPAACQKKIVGEMW